MKGELTTLQIGGVKAVIQIGGLITTVIWGLIKVKNSNSVLMFWGEYYSIFCCGMQGLQQI